MIRTVEMTVRIFLPFSDRDKMWGISHISVGSVPSENLGHPVII